MSIDSSAALPPCGRRSSEDHACIRVMSGLEEAAAPLAAVHHPVGGLPCPCPDLLSAECPDREYRRPTDVQTASDAPVPMAVMVDGPSCAWFHGDATTTRSRDHLRCIPATRNRRGWQRGQVLAQSSRRRIFIHWVGLRLLAPHRPCCHLFLTHLGTEVCASKARVQACSSCTPGRSASSRRNSATRQPGAKPHASWRRRQRTMLKTRSLALASRQNRA